MFCAYMCVRVLLCLLKKSQGKVSNRLSSKAYPSLPPSLPSLPPYLGRADDVHLFYLPVRSKERLEHGVVHGLGEHTHEEFVFSLRVHVGGADL